MQFDHIWLLNNNVFYLFVLEAIHSKNKKNDTKYGAWTIRDLPHNYTRLAREFVLSLNQATKLLESENRAEMTTFLKNIGSDCILQNRQLIFSPRKPYDLVAKRSEATASCLQLPVWWTVGDSNSRPSPCHGDALPATLTAQK